MKSNNKIFKLLIILFLCYLFFKENIVFALSWSEDPLEYNYHNIWRMIEFIGHKSHNTLLNYYASEFMLTKNHMYTFESETGWNISVPLIDFAKEGILPELRSYMSLSEITFLMPSPKEMNLSYAEYLDSARLIQFMETSRYIEAFYENKSYITSDIPVVYISNSFAFTCLYNESNELIAYLDKSKNSFVYQGKNLGQYTDFVDFIKKSWDSLIKTLFPKLNYEVRDWEFLNAESLTLTETFASGMFSKKKIAQKKWNEIKNLGLNPEDKKIWKNYKFKFVKFSNPYFLKWRHTPFLLKKNSLKKPFTTDSLAKQHNNLKDRKFSSKDINFLKDFTKECFSFVNEININHKKNSDFISPIANRNKLPLHSFRKIDEARSVPKFFTAYSFTGFNNYTTTWNYLTSNKIGKGNSSKLKYRPKERINLTKAWLGVDSSWSYYWAIIDRYEYGLKKVINRLLKTIPLKESNYKNINYSLDGDPRKILFNLCLNDTISNLSPIFFSKNDNNNFINKKGKLSRNLKKEINQLTKKEWEKILLSKNSLIGDLFSNNLKTLNQELIFKNLLTNKFFNINFLERSIRSFYIESFSNKNKKKYFHKYLNKYLKNEYSLKDSFNIKKILLKKKLEFDSKFLTQKLNAFWAVALEKNLSEYKTNLLNQKYNFGLGILESNKRDFWHKNVKIDKPYKKFYKNKNIFSTNCVNQISFENLRDLKLNEMLDFLSNSDTSFIKKPKESLDLYNTYGMYECWHNLLINWLSIQKKDYNTLNDNFWLASPSFFDKNIDLLNAISAIDDEEIKWLFFEAWTTILKDMDSHLNIRDKFTWETKPKFFVEVTDPFYSKKKLTLIEKQDLKNFEKWSSNKDIPFKEIHNLSKYINSKLDVFVNPFRMKLLGDEKYAPTLKKDYNLILENIAETYLNKLLQLFRVHNSNKNYLDNSLSGFQFTEKLLRTRAFDWKLDTNSKDSDILENLSNFMLVVNNIKTMNNSFKEREFSLKERNQTRKEFFLKNSSFLEKQSNLNVHFLKKISKKDKNNFIRFLSKSICDLKILKNNLEKEGYTFEKRYNIISSMSNKIFNLPSTKKLFLYTFGRVYQNLFGNSPSRYRQHNFRNHRISWLLVRNGRKRSKKNKWKGQIQSIIPLHRKPLPVYYRLTGVMFGKYQRGPVNYKGSSSLHNLIDNITLRDNRLLSNYFFRYNKYALKVSKKKWSVLRQKDGKTSYTRWQALFESPVVLTNHDKLDLFPLIDIFGRNISNIRNLEDSQNNLCNFYFKDNLNWRQILKTLEGEFYNNNILDFFFTKNHIINKTWLNKLKYYYFIKISKEVKSKNKFKLHGKNIWDIKFQKLNNLGFETFDKGPVKFYKKTI